jgi:hypothetical protein
MFIVIDVPADELSLVALLVTQNAHGDTEVWFVDSATAWADDLEKFVEDWRVRCPNLQITSDAQNILDTEFTP